MLVRNLLLYQSLIKAEEMYHDEYTFSDSGNEQRKTNKIF